MPCFRRAPLMAMVAVLLSLCGFRPVLAQQTMFDPFAIPGVEIDVTAANAKAAKDQGIVEGQRQAFTTLLERLVGADERARLPAVEGTDYVRDFFVERERTVGNRYLATLTVRFNGPALRKWLQGQGVTVTELRARPVVVVPVFVGGDGRAMLWDDPNPWRAAWNNLGGGGLVPLVLPLGDLGDIQAINANQALAGDVLAMQSLGTRWRTPDVLIAAASLHGTVLDVTLHAGPATPKPFDTLSYRQNDGESQDALLARAVHDISRAVDTVHRQSASQARGGADGTVSALVPLSGFEQWLAVRDRLSRIPAIRRWELVSLSRVEAAVILHVAGDSTQVGEALAKGGLALNWSETFWTLTPTATNP